MNRECTLMPMGLSRASLGVIRRLIRWVIRLILVGGMGMVEEDISREVMGMVSLGTTRRQGGL